MCISRFFRGIFTVRIRPNAADAASSEKTDGLFTEKAKKKAE
jgi:hypothetical protein